MAQQGVLPTQVGQRSNYRSRLVYTVDLFERSPVPLKGRNFNPGPIAYRDECQAKPQYPVQFQVQPALAGACSVREYHLAK